MGEKGKLLGSPNCIFIPVRFACSMLTTVGGLGVQRAQSRILRWCSIFSQLNSLKLLIWSIFGVNKGQPPESLVIPNMGTPSHLNMDHEWPVIGDTDVFGSPARKEETCQPGIMKATPKNTVQYILGWDTVTASLNIEHTLTASLNIEDTITASLMVK